jgi:hypothetical protein
MLSSGNVSAATLPARGGVVAKPMAVQTVFDHGAIIPHTFIYSSAAVAASQAVATYEDSSDAQSSSNLLASDAADSSSADGTAASLASLHGVVTGDAQFNAGG